MIGLGFEPITVQASTVSTRLQGQANIKAGYHTLLNIVVAELIVVVSDVVQMYLLTYPSAIGHSELKDE